MRTWIKNTLIAALGASVALGGMAVASTVRDGCGWHGHGSMSEADMAKFRERIIDRASSELSLDATQRQHLVALADTLQAQRQSFMPAGSHPREQLQSLIAGERFDAARAQSLVSEKTEAVRNASPAVIAAAATFYDSLRPEQQQKVRDFMARGRHHGWRG
ncbi:Spy/CpxP family protein refolding chaperone [Ideonella sp. DXS29W]|uniref:Spy/CpxP family protein refolding chaperone n=1 Tax=Ideonella lacteola TaxID=2984193 RepID=A0ABU9BKW3_9BURK